jgi:hypothetical protein
MIEFRNTRYMILATCSCRQGMKEWCENNTPSSYKNRVVLLYMWVWHYIQHEIYTHPLYLRTSYSWSNGLCRAVTYPRNNITSLHVVYVRWQKQTCFEHRHVLCTAQIKVLEDRTSFVECYWSRHSLQLGCSSHFLWFILVPPLLIRQYDTTETRPGYKI